MITVFMLSCLLLPSKLDKSMICFKSVNDCTYYKKVLNNQQFIKGNETNTYTCICKLVPSIDPDKVKVY